MLRLRSTTLAFMAVSILACGCCHWHPLGSRRHDCAPATTGCCEAVVTPECQTPAFGDAGPVIGAPGGSTCLPPTNLVPQTTVPPLTPTPRLVPQPQLQSQPMPYTP
jgi:hypothetical protein